MNTLPKTINGATLPDNEVWFIIAHYAPKIADLTRRLESAEKHANDHVTKTLPPGPNEELVVCTRCGGGEIELEQSCASRLAIQRDAHKARADKAEGELLQIQKRHHEVWTSRQELQSKLKEVTRHAESWKAIAQAAEAAKDSWERDCESLRQQLAQSAADNETYQQAANGWLEKFQQVSRENAELRATVASLQWVSLEVRKPTAEDADQNGDVDALSDNGVCVEPWDDVDESYTHWRRTNLPVEKVETTDAAFNKWCEDTGVLRNVAKIYARSLFDKAREEERRER